MIVGGIDIGSRAAKAVVMSDGAIVSSAICDTGPESVKTAETAMAEVLKGTGLALKNLDYVVATGYGRVLVPFAAEKFSLSIEHFQMSSKRDSAHASYS